MAVISASIGSRISGAGGRRWSTLTSTSCLVRKRMPDDMPLALASLAEPLTSCIRALARAQRAGGLGVAAAQEMGAGRVIVVGAPENPRLALCRRFGAEATVSLDDHETPEERIEVVRGLTGPFGADLVIDCSGHPSAGPEGIEMLRDGGTYVEMGQFTDAGAIETNWHRICTKDVVVFGSWAFTANDIPLGIAMLNRARDRYPWSEMQTRYPFTEEGIGEAVNSAIEMRSVKSTIVPAPDLIGD